MGLLQPRITRAYLLADPSKDLELIHRYIPGSMSNGYQIQLPENAPTPPDSVICLELDD